jgi:DNA-binding LacI/PurR family transcriptional regulator
VLIGARPRERSADSVGLDDLEAGRLATQHLIELGHRGIATVTGPMAEDCAQDRLAGYEQILCQHEITPEQELVLEGDWTANSGYQALVKLVQDETLPTAIFAQNDQMAVGVLHAARDLGIAVPTRLSVIGVDDIPLAAHFEPPLTTVRQDFAGIGREAARLLIRAVTQPAAAPEHVRMMPDLVVRKSIQCVSPAYAS